MKKLMTSIIILKKGTVVATLKTIRKGIAIRFVLSYIDEHGQCGDIISINGEHKLELRDKVKADGEECDLITCLHGWLS